MTIKQRAISDEQKQQRRQEILDVALQMFEATSYEAVNIAAVAKKAGIAKGTVYLYFNTKEALFLALQAQAFAAWFDEIDSRLEAFQPAPEADAGRELAILVGDSFENHPALVRLAAILHTVLEHNIDSATAADFKRLLYDRVLQTGALIEAGQPWLAPGQGARLLLRIHALVIGLQHLAEPAPVVNQVLAARPELQIFKIDFRQEFVTTFTALMKGLKR